MAYRIKFYKQEIIDLAIATLYVAFVFSFSLANPYATISTLPIFLLITVLSFIPHELAHKFAAIRYGCVAFFKLWKEGVLFSLALLPLGFKILIPGAVMIYPYRFARWAGPRHLTQKENGIISLVGPLANILVGIAFYFLPGYWAKQIALLNFWLAFFNLLPIPPLDGSKVIFWSFAYWIVAILIPSTFLFLL